MDTNKQKEILNNIAENQKKMYQQQIKVIMKGTLLGFVGFLQKEEIHNFSLTKIKELSNEFLEKSIKELGYDKK